MNGVGAVVAQKVYLLRRALILARNDEFTWRIWHWSIDFSRIGLTYYVRILYTLTIATCFFIMNIARILF